MPCSYYFKQDLNIKNLYDETNDISLQLDKEKLIYKLSQPIFVRQGSILMVTHVKGEIGLIDNKNGENSISDFLIEPFDTNFENRSLIKIDQMLKMNCLTDNPYYLHEISITKKYYLFIPYDIRIKLAKSTKNINIKLNDNQSE